MGGTKSLDLQQLVNALIATLSSSPTKERTSDISVAQLEELERKLQIASSVLRGMRNSLQPINKLPPEILAEVFMNTKQNLPSFLPLVKGGIRFFDNSSWLSLIHVCRHWRGIVASSPALWGMIDNLRGGVKPEVSLKRSRSAPLDIFLSITGPEFAAISPELLDTLVPHTFRFRQFHMNTDGWFGEMPIYASLKDAAPLLYSLSIVTKGRDVVQGVLPRLFNDEMPSLRQLTLEHFTSWPAGYFVNLTHLCLFDQWNETPASRPSTSEFLDFLDASPGLEELAIVRAGPTRTDDEDLPRVSPGNRKVSLKHLRELNLGDWPSTFTVSRFLGHLDLPSSTHMFIWGRIFLSSSRHQAPPIDRRSPSDSLTWLPSDISALGPLLNLKEVWLTRMPETWARGECPFVAILNDVLYLWGFFATDEILPLVQIPLVNVRKLQVRDCFPHPQRLTSGMWAGFFQRMEKLECLTILARDCPVVTRTVLATLHPKMDIGSEEAKDGALASTTAGNVATARTRRTSPAASPVATLRGENDIDANRTVAARTSSSSTVASSSRSASVSGKRQRRMTFSKDSQTTTSSQDTSESVLCPNLTSIRIEDNPHIPTLFISSLAKKRARKGYPIRKMEIMYMDRQLHRPTARNASSGSSDTSSSGDDGSDVDHDGIDVEYQGFTESDYRSLSKYIDEVVVDVSKDKLADVGPPQWPNQAFRWTLPTRVQST